MMLGANPLFSINRLEAVMKDGYMIREGVEALKNLITYDYIIHRHKNGSMDFLMPTYTDGTNVHCMLVKSDVHACKYNDLKQLQEADLCEGTEPIIFSIKDAEIEPKDSFFTLTYVPDYEKKKTVSWPMDVFVGQQIYTPANFDDGGGWAPRVMYIGAVHTYYVSAFYDGYENVRYKLRRNDYNDSWFTSYDECVKKCKTM